MQLRLTLYVVMLCVCVAPMVSAQDAAKVDSTHYTVVSENAQVRILRVHYGPHEKSIMHSHPATVAVFLTDAAAKFTYPDGKTEIRNVKAGDAQYSPSTIHLPENTGDNGMDVIVVELKSKAHKTAKMEMK